MTKDQIEDALSDIKAKVRAIRFREGSVPDLAAEADALLNNLINGISMGGVQA